MAVPIIGASFGSTVVTKARARRRPAVRRLNRFWHFGRSEVWRRTPRRERWRTRLPPASGWSTLPNALCSGRRPSLQEPRPSTRLRAPKQSSPGTSGSGRSRSHGTQAPRRQRVVTWMRRARASREEASEEKQEVLVGLATSTQHPQPSGVRWNGDTRLSGRRAHP